MLQHGGSVDIEMLAETDWRRLRKPGDDALQQILAIAQCRFRAVVSLAVQQIEYEVPKPVPTAGLQVRLQIVEAGNAPVVLDDDLAVYQRGAETKTRERICDGAKARRPVERLSGEQARGAAVDARLNPVAVVLDLVNPFRAAWRLLARRCPARLEKCRQQALSGAGNAADVGQDELAPTRGSGPRLVVDAQLSLGRELLVGAAADARGDFLVGDFRVAGMAGGLLLGLDEKPPLRLLPPPWPHTDQMPATLEPRAVEPEGQVTLREPLVGIALGKPAAAIPDDHRSAAIFAFRNVTLETAVFDRVVLCAHRKALFAQRQARPPRHRPAFQNPVKLKPQVVMQPACRVLLHHEFAGRPLPLPTLPRLPGG